MAIPVPVPKQSLFKNKAAKVAQVLEEAYAYQAAKKGFSKASKGEGVPLLPEAGLPPSDKVKPTIAGPITKAEMEAAKASIKAEQEAKFLAESKPSTIAVVIPSQLYHMIMSKPSSGGGWQSIMAQLQASTDNGTASDGTIYLILSPYLLAKIVDKATIGSGGYQAVMRWVVCLAAKQHPGAVIAGKGE